MLLIVRTARTDVMLRNELVVVEDGTKRWDTVFTCAGRAG